MPNEGYPGFTPDLGEFTPKDGELYRPSNGTEGDCFQARFCEHCKADKAFRDSGYESGNGCEILAATLAYDASHPRYPKAWIWKNGVPVCTAFDDEAERITNEERAAQLPLDIEYVANMQQARAKS